MNNNYCRKCGNVLGPGMSFCGVCGTQNSNMNVQPNLETQAQPNVVPNNNPGVQVQPNVMPNNNQQPMYNQYNNQMYNRMPNNEHMNQNNGGNKALVIAIIGLAVVAIVIAILIFVLPKKDEKPNKSGNNSTVVDNNKNENTNPTPVATTDIITVDGYHFATPAGYIIKESNGRKAFVNSSISTVIIPYMIDKYNTYSVYLQEVDKEILEYPGEYAKEIKKVDGKEYLIVNILSEGYEGCSEVYTTFSGGTAIFAVVNVGNKTMEDILPTIASLLSNAKSTNNSSFSHSEAAKIGKVLEGNIDWLK